MSYRSMVIYPLLNPDAFVYRSEGVSKENPIRDRLIDMNGGNDSFCNWSSNGRGVSLERNSSIGFERRKKYENSNDIFNGSPEMFSGNMPESEPELCALFDDILKYQNVKVFLQIAQGKNLLYSPGICEKRPGGSRIVKSVQRISGLKRKNEEIVESGIVDSIAVRFGIRSLKVISEQVDLKYMRDILYSLPILV